MYLLGMELRTTAEAPLLIAREKISVATIDPVTFASHETRAIQGTVAW